ncbi:hypothetical protein [Nocardiopsis sp. JB363]|uniref:hypothetical protein n=1 Tax=Nocardiopsis sp. JB363 TaxID=1434837 RepID=UPI000B355FDF|nr:hypothetical protein [Nocardiopsis sp. JB363]
MDSAALAHTVQRDGIGGVVEPGRSGGNAAASLRMTEEAERLTVAANVARLATSAAISLTPMGT